MSNDIATIELQVDNTPVLKLVTALNSAEKAYKKFDKAYTDGKITLEQALKGIKETEVGVERLRKAVDTGAGSAKRLGYEMQESQKKARRFELGVQQAGYQVGDFFVQVQSGTNPLVAFGQQATQLAGFFAGPWGAGIGAGIAILTSLGAILMRTDSATKEAKKSAEEYASALKQVETATQDLIDKQEKLLFLDSPLAKTLSEQSQLEAKAESVRYQLEAVNSMLEKVTDPSKWNQALIDKDMLDSQKLSLQNQLKTLEDELNIYHAQEEALRMLNGGLSVASGLNKAAIRDKQAALQATKEQALAEQAAADKANYLKSVFHALAGEAGAVSVNVGQWAGHIDAAISALGRYNAQATLNAKMVGRGLPVGFGQGIVGGISTSPVPQGRPIDLAENAAEAAAKAAKKAGGGGSKGPSEETVENRLKALYEYLGETKKVNAYLIEEENIAFSQREDLLKSALDKKLITLQEYQQMELDLTTMHQEALNKIESSRQDQRLGDAATFFGGLADVTKAGGDKTAKAARIFSAAQGLINAYLAYTQVLADPSLIGRPWARFGMAASALASGLSAVAAIKSGGGSVSGGGSGGSVGTSKIPSESQQATTVMIQGMKPTDIFTGEQLSTLFDSLYKENNNRGMVFMVQR